MISKLNPHSLLFKVAFPLVVMVALFLLLLNSSVRPLIEKNDRENLVRSQEETVEQVAYTIDLMFRKGAREMASLAADPAIASMEPARIDGLLASMNSVNQFFSYFFVVDREGRWVSYPTKPHLAGRKLKNDYWIAEALNRGAVSFLDVHIAATINTLVSGFAAPVLSAGGEAVGVVRGVITVSDDNFVLEMVRNTLVGSSGYAFVVDSAGRLLAHPTVPLGPENYEDSDFSIYPPVRAALDGSSGTAEYDFEGRRWIASYRAIPTTGWGVVVQQPLADMLADIGEETASITKLFFLIYLVSALILGSIAYISVRPVRRLLQNLRSGRTVPEHYYSKDEIGQLAREINSLFAVRVRAEESLRQSEELFRMIASASNDMIHLNDTEGNILYVNPATTTHLGYDPGELEGSHAGDLVHPDDRGRLKEDMRSKAEGGSTGTVELRLRRKDGSWLDAEVSGFRVSLDADRQFLGAVLRDISLRKRLREQLERQVLERTRELSEANEKLLSEIAERGNVEKALRESEERYKDIFENAGDMIQVVKPDGRLLYVNPSWLRTFGYSDEDMPGLSIFDIIAPDCKKHCIVTFDTVLEQGQVDFFETTFVTRRGEAVLIEGSASCRYEGGEPLYTRCILRDVTEKKKMEEELRKVHKLESLGVLAGGIAHDFNNILTAVLGNITLARLHVEGGTMASTALEEAEQATMRAKDLTRQLLTFSKGGEPVKQIVPLTEIIEASSRFALRGSNVKCEISGIEGLWLVDADEGQVSQVIHNLILNADQAMPDGGVVFIEGKNVTLGTDSRLPLDPGRYVEVSLRDEGSGIDPDDLPRIFDPFFSTKEKGQGLGLSSAFSIVKKHGGLLTVDSAPGEGSTFRMYLPATDEAPDPPRKDGGAVEGGHGRVLLMDDEVQVRTTASRMLGHLGYEVTLASEGRDAVDRYREAFNDGEGFDVVILDLTVPGGLGGREAAKEILALDPGARIVVSSGYANDPVMANYGEYGFRGIIPKPYRIEELGRTLRDLLD